MSRKWLSLVTWIAAHALIAATAFFTADGIARHQRSQDREQQVVEPVDNGLRVLAHRRARPAAHILDASLRHPTTRT